VGRYTLLKDSGVYVNFSYAKFSFNEIIIHTTITTCRV